MRQTLSIDNLFEEMKQVLTKDIGSNHFNNSEIKHKNNNSEGLSYRKQYDHYKKRLNTITRDYNSAKYDYYSTCSAYFHVIPALVGIYYVSQQNWVFGKEVTIEHDIMKFSFTWFVMDSIHMFQYGSVGIEFAIHHF